MATKEATLPGTFSYGRKVYTPEDTEFPEGLFDRLVEQGILEKDGSPNEAAEDSDEDLFEGLSDEQVDTLEAAGYGDAEAIAAASSADLEALDGIGKATVKKLKERAGA